MLASMTGFVSQDLSMMVDNKKVTISLNLKSLNSRFFETLCKLPPQLNHLETDIIKLLKKKLHRGHIYLSIHLDPYDAFKSEINASLPVIEKYLKAVDNIQKSFSITGNISLSDLINLPYVFNTE